MDLADAETSMESLNRATVYVWDPKTDAIEQAHPSEFTNNEDGVTILIAKAIIPSGNKRGSKPKPEIIYECSNGILEPAGLDNMLWTWDDEQCDHGEFNDGVTLVEGKICNEQCKYIVPKITKTPTILSLADDVVSQNVLGQKNEIRSEIEHNSNENNILLPVMLPNTGALLQE